MDKYSRLKQKFENKEKIISFSIDFTTAPFMLENMCNSFDLDYVFFDTEHSVFDNASLVNNLHIMRLLGMPTIVRVENVQYNLIAKAIDFGADGIMLPRIEKLDQIKLAVQSMFLPPYGKSGYGGHGLLRKGEKAEDFHKTRFLLPQIESPDGIKNLPEILEKYGDFISAVIVGPYDLSFTLGVPYQFESKTFLDAVQKVFDIAKKYNKSVGIFCEDENYAKRFYQMGANVIWLSCDKNYMLRGMKCYFDGVKDL